MTFLAKGIFSNIRNYHGEHNLIKLSRSCNVIYTKALYATKQDKEESEIPKNAAQEYYNSHLQSKTGEIYDKKPFKVRLYPNKVYHWCTCGQSKTQPFCDGTHKSPYLKIKLRPVRLEVTEEKDYWLCNCKQTARRPFCDGTHKRPDIQEKRI